MCLPYFQSPRRITSWWKVHDFQNLALHKLQSMLFGFISIEILSHLVLKQNFLDYVHWFSALLLHVAGGRGNQPHPLRQPKDWLRIRWGSRSCAGIVRRFLQSQVQQPGQLPKWCAKGWQRHSSVCSPNHHGWQVLRFDLPVWLWLRYLSCMRLFNRWDDWYIWLVRQECKCKCPDILVSKTLAVIIWLLDTCAYGSLFNWIIFGSDRWNI